MKFCEYLDKVNACWMGKNIGGTLGMPYECVRGAYDVDYYKESLIKNGPIANDDLELQLLCLCAAERYGTNLTAEILGEYWLMYVTGSISEYGAGKNNLAMGLQPPISGWYGNHNKDSNGAFIRSELWACLMPGHPELAIRYAYEDAAVDHCDEGLYGEIFTAALESAAFSETDRIKLIEIGLSYIPSSCGVALGINTAKEAYRNNLDWKNARAEVLKAVPCSIGMYGGNPEEGIPVGKLGYDVPATVGIVTLALLYGEGEFDKSVRIAAGCAEDGDCTAATVGSILGIINGTAGISEKWTKPLGDDIAIQMLKRSQLTQYPKTITELTQRVAKLTPLFMRDYERMCFFKSYYSVNENGEIMLDLFTGNSLYNKSFEDHSVIKKIQYSPSFYYSKQPFGIKRKTALFDVTLDYVDGISISEGKIKKFKLLFDNKMLFQRWICVKWYIPDDWSVKPGNESMLFIDQQHGGCATTEKEYEITPNNLKEGKYECHVVIRIEGHPTVVAIPITLIID